MYSHMNNSSSSRPENLKEKYHEKTKKNLLKTRKNWTLETIEKELKKEKKLWTVEWIDVFNNF